MNDTLIVIAAAALDDGGDGSRARGSYMLIPPICSSFAQFVYAE